MSKTFHREYIAVCDHHGTLQICVLQSDVLQNWPHVVDVAIYLCFVAVLNGCGYKVDFFGTRGNIAGGRGIFGRSGPRAGFASMNPSMRWVTIATFR